MTNPDKLKDIISSLEAEEYMKQMINLENYIQFLESIQDYNPSSREYEIDCDVLGCIPGEDGDCIYCGQVDKGE